MTKSRQINRPRAVFSEFADAIMVACYPYSHTQALAMALRMHQTAIYSRAGVLGLKKNAWFLHTPLAARVRKDRPLGTCTRFIKGGNPWNKGRSMPSTGRSAETQFKPGHRPKNWRPLGSTRVNVYGYIEMKMSEGINQYKPLHRVIFERMHGPIPDGYNVTFRDGSKINISITNLELKSREEHGSDAKLHSLPAEIRQSIQLRGAIQRKINDAKQSQRL